MDSAPATPVHLLCLMHGMWGNPVHLDEAARVIREKADARGHGGQFEILVAQANQKASTYDGIDWGGERIADEICEHIKELEKDPKKKVTKFSVLGYSLGGLLGRYVIGILQSRKFFDMVEPVNFNTIATPHVGLPRYPSVWSSISNSLGPRLLSRTGEQFYNVDQWTDSGMSLLEVMAMPDSIFLEALQRFPQLAIYANAVNDLTVPYVTASISEQDPYADHEARGLAVEFLENYKPIVASFTVPETPPPKPKSPRIFSKPWLQKIKAMRPPLPPFLQKPFPLNIVLYAAIPVLLPTFLCIVLVRLSLDSRASRARVKLLEAESSQGKLISILRTLEKEMDDVVADFVDDPGRPGAGLLVQAEGSSSGSSSSSSASIPVSSPPGSSDIAPANPSEPENQTKEDKLLWSKSKPKWPKSKSKSPESPKPSKNIPQLKHSQQRMIRSLNTGLMHMRKYAVFIHPIRNSHGTIISRDVKNFDSHRLGEGVLKHWADTFVF